MPCCEISDCAQVSKTIIAVRNFGLGGRESLETAVNIERTRALRSWITFLLLLVFMCNCCLVQELRSEVENLASRVLYMQEAKEDVRSDISVMKRAAEKAHGEVTQAEQLKKKQVCVWHYGKFPL